MLQVFLLYLILVMQHNPLHKVKFFEIVLVHELVSHAVLAHFLQLSVPLSYWCYTEEVNWENASK